MDKERLDFLKKLMETISPSGYEEDVSRLWREEALLFSGSVKTDSIGNSIANLSNYKTLRPLVIMLAGHIDEIGLMVTYIDDDGFIYFSGIGGWDPQILPGQHVWIKTKKGIVNGVIGKNPIHLIEAEERKKAVEIKDLWIDIGAKNKKEASSLVEIGDSAVIQRSFQKLMNNMVACRGFDDKIGAFIVLEALRILSTMELQNMVYAVATTQEEVGLRGAKASAHGIGPDIGIAVDVGFSTDTPATESKKKILGEAKMGKGPIIARGVNISPWLFGLFVETAKEEKIPYQIQADARPTGTDANVIQMTRAGVATGLISIPNRYMHSPCEIVHLGDVENTIKLIAKTVAKISTSNIVR